MLQRVKRAVGAESKVQPVQKEDALSPVEKAETPSKKKVVADVAAQAEEHRFGAGSAESRVAAEKEEGEAQGLLDRGNAVDEKIQNEYRRKRILQEEAVTSKRELQDMALERWRRKQGTLRASATTRSSSPRRRRIYGCNCS